MLIEVVKFHYIIAKLVLNIKLIILKFQKSPFIGLPLILKLTPFREYFQDFFV
jgi:hypothetical protein